MVFTFVSSAEGPALYFHMNQLPFTMSLGIQHLTAQRNYHAFTFYFIKMKDLDFSLFLPAKQDRPSRFREDRKLQIERLCIVSLFFLQCCKVTVLISHFSFSLFQLMD